jgi:putative nucleotidyltransferase with HDIG domain
VVTLTSALGQRFYNAPRLDVGKAAPQTLYAPESVTVEDTKATEERRKAARKNAVSVLMLDLAVTQQVGETVQQHLTQGSELRKLVSPFPFLDTGVLSTRTQAHLRQVAEEEFQQILVAASVTSRSAKPQPPALSSLSDPASRQAAIELQTQRQTNSKLFTELVQTLAKIRFNYTTAINSLPAPATPEVNPPFDAELFELTDADWQQVQALVPEVTDRMMTQGIPFGLPEEVLRDAIKRQLRGNLSQTAASIATRLLMLSLQPNLIQDEAQTRLTAERAAQEIKPETVSIRRGERIVWAGEEITTANFALLDRFGMSRRGTDWWGLLAFGTLVSGTVAVYGWVELRRGPKLRQRDRLLILLLGLSTPLLLLLRVPSTNLPAVGFLVSTFYNSPLALAVVGLLTGLLPIGMSVHWSQLIASAAGGLVCAGWAGRLRSREELALLGVGVGILQGTVYLLLNVVTGGMVWYTLLNAAAIQALMGLAWIVAAMGVSPYLEQVFDLITTIRLAELANPNRPLLKRLAAEAPGTFQHTLFVATLAEAAARSLGCNVELVRTGTLYHDIGKMHDPLGFIENQMGGPNKHDQIDDPWKSVEIIKKHVTEGLVMARRCRLPRAVQAFIPEHQGTMLVAYFYHQAQQRSQEIERLRAEGVTPTASSPAVREADFRYAGPTPQSKETGIVMLADSCEAALRSLKDANYEDALSMINKILRARWQDNQLVDSGLTREDLGQIATVFVEVWQQFNHQRITYPKLNPQPAQSP